ncbi:MAG: TRAP transporter large permease [Eubacteriaceae bacterium]
MEIFSFLSISVVLLFIGVPITVSLMMGVIITNIFFNIYPTATMATIIYHSLDSYVLVAIPLFLLAGITMSYGGISKKIFDFAESLVGFTRGALGNVNIVASMIFGGMSGSSVADVAGLGLIEISEMTKREYPKQYATAVTVASSTMSVVIPPSILLVIYAVSSGVSVGSMLLAGFFPGIIIGFVLMLTNIIISKKNKWGTEVKFSLPNILKQGYFGFPALLMPLIIIGGIFSGIFTATEASAIALLYAILIGIFLFKSIKLKDLTKILYEGGKTTGIVALELSCGLLLANFLVIEDVPNSVVRLCLSITDNPFILMSLINIVLLFAGMFLNPGTAIIVFSQVFLPLISEIGYNPIHFGIIMVVNLAIGLITPPVGSCLYAGSAVSGLKIEEIIKPLIPFFIALVLSLVLIIILPSLSLYLPSLSR